MKEPFYGDSEATLAAKAIYDEGYRKGIEDAAKVANKYSEVGMAGALSATTIAKEIRALLEDRPKT